MGQKRATVVVLVGAREERALLELEGTGETEIRLDSPQWFAWLTRGTTHSFAYPLYDRQVGYIRGWITVRKEQRARGNEYWVAYRRVVGRLRKIYLGRSAQVTRQRLAASGDRFLAME